MERLQKYISESGYASRRKAEELILNKNIDNLQKQLEKEEKEALLMEKMERWEYLEELAAKIAAQ